MSYTIGEDLMLKKHTDGEEVPVIKEDRMELHIELKRVLGLEHLHFYSTKAGYCCKYISDPNDFDINDALKDPDLIWFLNVLSYEQGKIWFEDYGQWCVGITGLKELYLPIMLGGL